MKKGFTLIELLAVIVILAVIVMISVPVIGNAIQTSKEKAYDQQITQIENAARTYMSTHSNELPDDGSYNVSVDTLKKEGLLPNKEIKNPKTDESMDDEYVIITCQKTNDICKYSYNYSDKE